jgi:hypothetical protein
VVLGALVLTAAGAGVVAINGTPRGPGGSLGTAPSDAPPTAGRIAPPARPGTTYRDFVFETETVTAPTATKAQSKLWYAADTWWAGMYQPISNQLHIFKLDWATQDWADTGTLVDERTQADPDFLWDDEHLYVVSAGHSDSVRHAGRVLRFSLDEKGERFTLDHNFPVTVTPSGTSAAVIAIDSTGVLWIAYQQGGRIWIVHSLDHAAHWTDPFVLPVAGTTVDPGDLASVVAFGPGRIGVMWSNQLDDTVYFSSHVDGAPSEAWSAPEIVIDDVGTSDDHINLKAYPRADGGTGVVAALKTSLDAQTNPNPLAPLILLAVRDGTGVWTAHQVARVQDRQTRAVVMVDADAREFYVAATTPGRGGSIVYKRTSIDDPTFDTAPGEPLIQSLADLKISNATSTKQPLTRASGMVVLASDNDTGRYLHGVVDLGGGMPDADPADPTRSDLPVPPDPDTPLVLVDTDFEPWNTGSADGTGWLVREGDPPGAITIVSDGAGRSLRLAPTAKGASVRACRDLPVTLTTPVSASLRFRVNTTGLTDTTVVSLRGSGGDLGSVRISKRGRFSFFDGPRKVEPSTRFVRRGWYRLLVVVDQGRRTYDITIRRDDGTVVMRRRGLAWRRPDVPSVREMCLETSTGQPKQRIDVSDVRVLQEPGA